MTSFGVIGICGANGNLVARILKDRGYDVVGTDMSSKKECRFKNSLDDIEVFYESHPEEFFEKSDYIIPPISLPKSAKVFDIIHEKGIPVLEVSDIIDKFDVGKPVFGITGTNGKTTTTTLLKKIAYDNGITPAEHNLDKMQGNAEYIPILQSRLNGDVGILEIGTFGVPGTISRIADNSGLCSGLITNITPDHLNDLGGFMEYAHVKGEFIKALNGKQIIVNGQDPTIMGLLDGFEGEVITFGVDGEVVGINTKECVCGRQLDVKEIISGSGYYLCECGLTNPELDYVATNIDLKNRTFDLYARGDKLEVKMLLDGLHNVYNVSGVIIAAHEFLGLSYDKILDSVASFTGVSGRMEKIATIDGKDVIVDFAHNPAGVETVLREFKKLYGDITTVITISSESGDEGDLEIFNKVLKFSKYVVPASSASQKIASAKINDDEKLSEKIILNHVDDFVKKGTIGATFEEVQEGINEALKLDCDKIVAIGEAATKFKDCVYKLK